jgi:16S rRNA (guanine(966)-N(2))-methyltransferase RsmD
MRISGNRLLKTLPGQATRPTLAKVREALFNIWQGAIADSRWLDLCAGNGSMGAEALCQGASLVIGIEKSPQACQIIRQNWTKVSQENQIFQIFRGDVIISLSRLKDQQFDLIYFDPPYRSHLYEPVLEAIAEKQLLASQGEIAVEHDPKLWQPIKVQGLTICREKRYGNTALTFYHLT